MCVNRGGFHVITRRPVLPQAATYGFEDKFLLLFTSISVVGGHHPDSQALVVPCHNWCLMEYYVKYSLKY